MIQRLYVHNFRCLENFELSLKDMSSALLIGKNGVGKSTIFDVLEIFQSIGRGTNRMRVLKDLIFDDNTFKVFKSLFFNQHLYFAPDS
jgi:recombinational DNA repair ATPase RecF